MVSSEFVMGQEEEKCAVCRKLRNGGNAKGSATRPGEVAQVAAGRVPKETATIDITADQARNIRAFIKQESENHNQTYGVAGHNCTQFSEAALKAGGMSHVPNATTPRDLVEQLIKNGASPGP